MKTSSVRSICPFCSMGCSLRIESGADAPYVGEAGIPSLDYDPDGPFNRGSLCSKGNMALELCTHPGRLEAPRLRIEGGGARSVGWEEAFRAVASRLLAVRDESGPRSIGVYLGPSLTDEEVRAAITLARALGTPNVDGGSPEDQVFLGGVTRSGAQADGVGTIEQIESMTAMLCVGDVLSVAPCLSRAILDARYDRRSNLLGTLSGSRNRTTWFGRPDLRCRPAREVAALALILRVVLEDESVDRPWAEHARAALARPSLAELEALAGLGRRDVVDLARDLARHERTGVFAAAIFGDTDRSDLAAGLAALIADATGSRFLPVVQGANAMGLRRALAAAGLPDESGLNGPEMLEAAVTGDLRALVALGFDPLASMPGALPAAAAERLELLVMTAPVAGAGTQRADVVLPSVVFGEKPGTVENAFGARVELGVALRPPGVARPELEILEGLLAHVRPVAADVEAAPPVEPPAAADATRGFFSDLDLYFRMQWRAGGAHEVGSHLLLPRASACHAGDGALTRDLSWPRHENPRPEVVLSERSARALGVAAGDEVVVRSPIGEARLAACVEPRVPDEVVFAPSHEPAVRHLMRWRFDSGLRSLDLRPGRVSVERAARGDRDHG